MLVQGMKSSLCYAMPGGRCHLTWWPKQLLRPSLQMITCWSQHTGSSLSTNTSSCNSCTYLIPYPQQHMACISAITCALQRSVLQFQHLSNLNHNAKSASYERFHTDHKLQICAKLKLNHWLLHSCAHHLGLQRTTMPDWCMLSKDVRITESGVHVQGMFDHLSAVR